MGVPKWALYYNIWLWVLPKTDVSYVILFTGTPLMDGKYTHIEAAYDAKERFIRRFPKLRFDIAQVGDKFDLSDDIFWANYKERLEQVYDEDDED